MMMKIKRLLQKFGYDIKKHRPVFQTTVRPLGIQTVLDIGANTGKTAVEFRAMFPQAQIIAFEPLPACFEELARTMKEDSRFKAYNIALGDTKGETVIEESSFHPSSSLLKMSELHKRLYPKSKDSTPRKIKIERLDDILAEETLEGNLFVKMDVQGFEDKVIKGGENTLAKAAAIQIETAFVELYKDQPLFDDIYSLLRSLGFAYYGDVGRHYDPRTGKLLYEESLFIKKELV